MSVRVRIICLVGLAALAGVICRWGLGQSPQQKKANPAAELFAQAQPHLEAVLGYLLPAQPEFRILTPAEYADIRDWETTAYLGWRFPGLQGAVRQNVRQLAQHAVAQATVARHVEGTNGIAVIPDNQPIIAGWDQTLAEARSQAFLQLELVHAVARMTLEQKHNLLDRQHDPQSLEEFCIGQALVEGRAQWLTWKVAERMGTTDAFHLMAECWRHVPDPSPDPQVRAGCQETLQQKSWAYLRGKQFFDRLEGNNLPDVESAVFTDPPHQLESLEKPALYVQQYRAGHGGLKNSFAKLAPASAQAGWKPLQQPWTPTMLKQVAGMLHEEKRAEQCSQGWQDGRALVWMDPKNAARYVSLSAATFTAEPAARSYYGFAVDLQRRRDELSGKPGPMPWRVLDSTYHDLDWPGLHEGLRNAKSLEATYSSPPFPATIVLARSGSLVMEFSWYGMAPDLDWARQTFEAVAGKMKKQ